MYSTSARDRRVAPLASLPREQFSGLHERAARVIVEPFPGSDEGGEAHGDRDVEDAPVSVVSLRPPKSSELPLIVGRWRRRERDARGAIAGGTTTNNKRARTVHPEATANWSSIAIFTLRVEVRRGCGRPTTSVVSAIAAEDLGDSGHVVGPRGWADS